MNPTAYLRKARREADPNHFVRNEYRRIARVMGIRISDCPLTIRRSRKHPQQAVGTAWRTADGFGSCKIESNRITITIGISVDTAAISTLLLHELAHIKTPEDNGHGDRWRSVFVDAASDVHGISVDIAAESSNDLHSAIETAIRDNAKGK
jgi:predicted metal-dependent hydrolase